MVIVHRHQRPGLVAENALQRAFRCGFHERIDLIGSNGLFGDDAQIDAGNIRGRHADRRTVELAVQLGQDQTKRLGGAGGRRDHAHRRGAGTVEILVQRIQRRLVAGVAVDRRHKAGGDAESIVDELGNGREAVGGARGIRNDVLAQPRHSAHPETRPEKVAPSPSDRLKVYPQLSDR